MHDLLQRQVAAHIGLSAQGLWNILNARSEPGSLTLRKCAYAFGVTIDDLFADTGTCLRAAANSYEAAPIRTAAHGNAQHASRVANSSLARITGPSSASSGSPKPRRTK